MSLYSDKELELMKNAEDALVKGCDRLEEIKNFAQKMGYTKIGLAHCVAVTKEAEAAKAYFSQFFEVVSIDCKNGRIPKSEILKGNYMGISCNPVGQAAYLAESNTQLNVVMGLCVGHDMIFTQHTTALSTTLLVKDRANKHNPMKSIEDKK